MSAKLLVDVHEHIQTITLNRPEKKNAFDLEMIEQWVAALQDAQQDEQVHVIVVTGAGDAFCSGGDVNNMKKEAMSALDFKNKLWEHIHRVPLTLNAMDKPVIAAINGPAAGAGLDMALMADIRTMAEGAKVAERYVKVGLIPGDGGAYFLPRIVGESKAYELLWRGNFIDAQESLRLGLVNHVFPRETFLEDTLAMASEIASGPQVAIRMTKRAVRQSMRVDLETALDLLSSHYAVVKDTWDHKEGTSAFLEKRKPNFQNK